jgi:hypothetical protein
MKRSHTLGTVALGFLLGACESPDPSQAVIDNGYSAADESAASVARGWWFVAAFLAPVPPGAESAPVRVVEGSDFAYALLAREADPGALIPVRTRAALSAKRGETLHLEIAPANVLGDCATGEPLSQTDADFITQRIFPGPFAGSIYDAATCTASPAGQGGAGGSGDSE